MAAFVDALVAQVLALEINLHACRARLAARTDGEALHDLRIALRRLRSLLRPLRDLPGIEHLEQAAAALGQLSGPLRDTEVLLIELENRGQTPLIATRRPALELGYGALLNGPELQRLFDCLDAWPGLCRRMHALGAWPKLRKRVGKHQSRQRRRLGEALRDPAHDRHRLRLLIKRVRYGAEAYPELARVPPKAQAALKLAQSALGNWHDLLQWLARAATETDLAPLMGEWQQALTAAEQAADRALEPLLEWFPAAADRRFPR